MTQDLQKLRQFVENAYKVNLVEGYNERIQRVAREILDEFGNKQIVMKNDVSDAIRRKINWPLGSVKIATVITDVITTIQDQLNIQKPKEIKDSLKLKHKAALRHLVNYLTRQLTDELGNIIPDGDPYSAFNTVINKAIQIDQNGSPNQLITMYGSPGINLNDLQLSFSRNKPRTSLYDWLQRDVGPLIFSAFEKEHGQDTYGYLADMWDQYRDDMEYTAQQHMQTMQRQGKPVPHDYVKQYLSQHGFAQHNPYR